MGLGNWPLKLVLPLRRHKWAGKAPHAAHQSWVGATRLKSSQGLGWKLGPGFHKQNSTMSRGLTRFGPIFQTPE